MQINRSDFHASTTPSCVLSSMQMHSGTALCLDLHLGKYQKAIRHCSPSTPLTYMYIISVVLNKDEIVFLSWQISRFGKYGKARGKLTVMQMYEYDFINCQSCLKKKKVFCDALGMPIWEWFMEYGLMASFLLKTSLDPAWQSSKSITYIF